MTIQGTAQSRMEVTDGLARLYLFLAQSVDRCASEAAGNGDSESALQANLASTKAAVMDMLSPNQVVKGKVEQECQRILSLVTACQNGGSPGKALAWDALKAERAVLKDKTMALSDLLAVFRAT